MKGNGELYGTLMQWNWNLIYQQCNYLSINNINFTTNEYSLGNKLSNDFERTWFGLRCIAPLVSGSRFSELKDTDLQNSFCYACFGHGKWLALDGLLWVWFLVKKN